jgi:hypothetical protein
MSFFSLKPLGLASIFCGSFLLSLSAATSQEEAFMKVWSAHLRAPQDHAAVIQTCQSVMDKSSTLGDYLPVVKTLAAWHLLASGNRTDATRIFESALTSDRGAKPIVRFADTMARRWLTRMDYETTEKALKAYYGDHVSYPDSLSPLFSLPPDKVPPKTDRFGDPWVYKTEEFTRIKGIANQRFTLYSKNVGTKLTALRAVPFTAYGKKRASILAQKNSGPLMVEFETVAEDGAAQRGAATEGGLVNGVRFLKLDSEGRFALLIDSECDFWVVATPARSR